jgi:Phosphoribosylanthranilate isomerase
VRVVIVAGCDVIGLVFYSFSVCHVNLEMVAEIVVGIPSFVSVVGLFVDVELEQINAVLKHVRLDMLQFHGNEILE